MEDLPLGDEILDRAGNVFDRHLRVDAVLVEEIDTIGAQAAQAAVDSALDVLGPAVQANAQLAGLGIDVETELAFQNHAVAPPLECLADDLLRDEGPYTSAVSMRVTPWSIARLISETAALRSINVPK